MLNKLLKDTNAMPKIEVDDISPTRYRIREIYPWHPGKVKKAIASGLVAALSAGCIGWISTGTIDMPYLKAQAKTVMQGSVSASPDESDLDDRVSHSQSTAEPKAVPTSVPTPVPTPMPTLVSTATSTEARNPTPAPQEVMYDIQVAACAIYENAYNTKQGLSNIGIDSVIEGFEWKEKGVTLYRVVLYTNMEQQDAIDVGKSLKSIGEIKDFFLIKTGRKERRDVESLSQADKTVEEGQKEFISQLSAYIISVNSNIDKDSAAKYAGAIYNVTKKYNLPPDFVFMIAGESRFSSVTGDQNNYYKGMHNPAESAAQIGILTQIETYEMLDKDGHTFPADCRMRNIKAERPDITKYYEDHDMKMPDQIPDIRGDTAQAIDMAILFAGRYFKECLKVNSGNIERALMAYNAGLESKGKNIQYLVRVNDMSDPKIVTSYSGLSSSSATALR